MFLYALSPMNDVQQKESKINRHVASII